MTLRGPKLDANPHLGFDKRSWEWGFRTIAFTMTFSYEID